MMLSQRPAKSVLVDRIVRSCRGAQRDRVRTEAEALVRWALAHVDALVLDEAIGETLAMTPGGPVLPRAFAPAVTNKALRYQIAIREHFTPPGSPVPIAQDQDAAELAVAVLCYRHRAELERLTLLAKHGRLDPPPEVPMQ